MFTVCINMAHECNKSELKLNTDSNDHETQTKIIASFAAIDISNLGHGAFLGRKINWPYQQKTVQNNSTWNKCLHLWKVPIHPQLISAQAGTETNLVFISTPDRIRETTIFLQDFRIYSTSHIFSPLSAPPVTVCGYTGLSGSTTRSGAFNVKYQSPAQPTRWLTEEVLTVEHRCLYSLLSPDCSATPLPGEAEMPSQQSTSSLTFTSWW